MSRKPNSVDIYVEVMIALLMSLLSLQVPERVIYPEEFQDGSQRILERIQQTLGE